MPKIRVTTIPRKPVDAAGIVSTLVDLAKKLREEAKAEQLDLKHKETSDA